MPTQRIGDTVVKTYREDLRWQWGREVAFLRKLADGIGGRIKFPRVLSVGDHSLTTRYCGESIATHPEVSLTEIRIDLTDILNNLQRAEIHHRDITIHNLLWNDVTGLTLIDFGWSRWDWEPDAPMPLPHVMHGLYRPDAEQAEALLRELEEMRNGK